MNTQDDQPCFTKCDLIRQQPIIRISISFFVDLTELVIEDINCGTQISGKFIKDSEGRQGLFSI